MTFELSKSDVVSNSSGETINTEIDFRIVPRYISNNLKTIWRRTITQPATRFHRTPCSVDKWLLMSEPFGNLVLEKKSSLVCMHRSSFVRWNKNFFHFKRMNCARTTVWMHFHVIGEKNVGRIQSETYSAASKSEKLKNHAALTPRTFKSNYLSNREITCKK